MIELTHLPTKPRFRCYRTLLQNSIAAFILLLFITSCTQARESTPQLKLAQDFVSGHSDIPPEHYIFLEATWNTKCDTGCEPMYDCPYVELTPPNYEWHGKNSSQPGLTIHDLIIDEKGTNTWDVDKDWKLHDLQPTPFGFLGYGEYTPKLHAITSLPITTLDKKITVHSVDSSGNIVAEIQGTAYFMEPGQRWSRQTESKHNGCLRVTTYQFVNRGLLDNKQIFLNTYSES
jgi:hypothetical protein